MKFRKTLALILIALGVASYLYKKGATQIHRITENKISDSSWKRSSAQNSKNDAHNKAAGEVERRNFSNTQASEAVAFLTRFTELNKKAVRNRQEQSDFESDLGNQLRLDEVFLFLSNREGFNENTRVETMNNRMLAIDYLARAAEFERNPIREDVFQSIKNLLVVDNLSEMSDDESRKIVVGDQVELFSILRTSAPQIAHDLARLSTGTRLAKIVAMSDGLYNSHKSEVKN